MAALTALVVVNHGSAELLDVHLRATADGLDSAVVVVDNSVRPEARTAARQVVERHGWHLVTCPNDGFGAGVNRGRGAGPRSSARTPC